MITLPTYIRFTAVLFCIIMIIFVLIIGRPLFSPLVLAIILSLLLHPFCRTMENWKVPPALSALTSIMMVFAALFIVFSYFSYEVTKIANEMPEVGTRIDYTVDKIVLWLEDNFGIGEQDQARYVKNFMNSFLEGGSNILGATVGMTADIIGALILLFISMFFLLYYRQFFVEFLYKVTENNNNAYLRNLLYKIEEVIKSYVLGIITVIAILAVLNTLGLFLIGIEYAFFFGVLAALLTIIPYLGVFIGSLLPIAYALLTKDALWYPVAVAVLFWFIQFMEGNFITPNIVGNKVSLNPFVVLVALFAGGLIWGPIGMILAIPVVAIAKVIFDEVEPLKPYGYLLGQPPKSTRPASDIKTVSRRVVKKV